jgi:hypothetical protein
MTPEHALPKRRRQILDDETQGAHCINASERPDASGHQDALHQDTLHQDTLHQDTWARNFVDRLAVLVRKIGGKNQTKNQA